MTSDDRTEIDVDLVCRLVAAQFPQWAGLPVARVAWDGWDNSTFRLGDEMKVRLPTARRYVAQVEKESAWLPLLAPHLPLEIPVPVALGRPGEGYPWPWAVYRWIEGETAGSGQITDLPAFASTLARFLAALQGIDATGGPAAGAHNFFRGGNLRVYDAETREAAVALRSEIDADAALEVWDTALKSSWRADPVWVHGDVAVGNLLVRDGRLAAVIDFGSSGIGDPACDLVIAWMFFDGDSRHAFRAALPLDDTTWARGRGWALWKALITYAADGRTHSSEKAAREIIETVIEEHRRGG